MVKRERTLIQTALARGLRQQPTDAERCIWNNDVLQNPDGVFAVIQETLTMLKEHPHSTFSLGGEK